MIRAKIPLMYKEHSNTKATVTRKSDKKEQMTNISIKMAIKYINSQDFICKRMQLEIVKYYISHIRLAKLQNLDDAPSCLDHERVCTVLQGHLHAKM